MNTQKPTFILFDVNETLLDMSDVKKLVNKTLGSKRGFNIWFGLLLQYSLVDTVTGQYHDFGSIADATLNMAAAALKTEIEEKERQEILSNMKELPAHGEVKDGLQQLKSAGYRLATLTNSAPDTLRNQLQHAGLDSFFEATLSVDEFKLYKPHQTTYEKALDKLHTRPPEALLVAAHGWDIAGAAAAGMQTAFIKREGQSIYPLAPQPTYEGKDLKEIVKLLLSLQ